MKMSDFKHGLDSPIFSGGLDISIEIEIRRIVYEMVGEKLISKRAADILMNKLDCPTMEASNYIGKK